MARDAFGLPEVPLEADDDFAFLKDQAPPETVVEPPQEPPAEPVAAPAEPVAAPLEGEPPAEPQLFAGKYLSVEELEKGYREVRDMSRRAAERAKAAEDARVEIEEKARQLEDTLRQAAPILQRVLQAPPPPQKQLYDEMGQPVPMAPQPVAPQVTPYDIEQTVAQRIAASQQQLQQQFAEQQAYAERERTVLNFYETHPEVTQGNSIDSDITETVRVLADAWGDSQLDVGNPDSLEIAYEATKNPNLRTVLSLNPSYIDTDEGMTLARIQAAMLGGTPLTQQISQVPASVVGQRKPNLESASQGAAPAAEAPLDDFDKAALEWRTHNRRTADSIFFE